MGTRKPRVLPVMTDTTEIPHRDVPASNPPRYEPGAEHEVPHEEHGRGAEPTDIIEPLAQTMMRAILVVDDLEHEQADWVMYILAQSLCYTAHRQITVNVPKRIADLVARGEDIAQNERPGDIADERMQQVVEDIKRKYSEVEIWDAVLKAARTVYSDLLEQLAQKDVEGTGFFSRISRYWVPANEKRTPMNTAATLEFASVVRHIHAKDSRIREALLARGTASQAPLTTDRYGVGRVVARSTLDRERAEEAARREADARNRSMYPDWHSL